MGAGGNECSSKCGPEYAASRGTKPTGNYASRAQLFSGRGVSSINALWRGRSEAQLTQLHFCEVPTKVRNAVTIKMPTNCHIQHYIQQALPFFSFLNRNLHSFPTRREASQV